MKKLFLVLAAAALSFGAAYAQDANEAPVEEVAVEQVVEAEGKRREKGHAGLFLFDAAFFRALCAQRAGVRVVNDTAVLQTWSCQ